MFKINGATMPEPTSIQERTSDLDNSDGTTRSASGKAMRDRIAVKKKYSITYAYISKSDASKVLKAMKSEFFQATLFDMVEGKEITKTYYVGDRTADVYSYNEKYEKIMYKNLKFDIIEQ